MRVIRDIGYVKRRRRAGKIMVGVGLLLLVGSWVVSFTYPTLFFLAMTGLVLGFISFNGGMQQFSRWSRRPRSDEVLDSELQRLNDRYTLIHYPELPGRRPDHVLVAPNGIYVMTTREITGSMSVNGRRWRLRRNPLVGMFRLGGPQLGNPTIENNEQVKAVRGLLEQQGVAIEPQGIVVFVAPDVEVEITDSPVPILHATELYEYIRDQSTDVTMGSRERDQIIETLARGDEIERVTAEPARPKKRVRAA